MMVTSVGFALPHLRHDEYLSACHVPDVLCKAVLHFVASNLALNRGLDSTVDEQPLHPARGAEDSDRSTASHPFP